MNRTRIFFVFLCVSLLVLTACGAGIPFSNRGSNNPNRDYYVGNDGVIMRFSDPTTPPSRFYYYEDGEQDDNSFQILIDVHNIGSSWTKGALFVSGYDPYMINIPSINIPRGLGSGPCYGDITSLGNSLGITGNCLGVNGQIGTGGVDINAQSIGNLLSNFGLDAEFLNNIGISVNTQGSGWDIGLSLDGVLDADVQSHGWKLIGLTPGFSFVRLNGKDYQGQQNGNGMLEPDYPQFPGGEVNTIPFDVQVRNWPQGFDRTDKPVTFLVTNCFLYTTIATPQVCIDPAPYDQGVKVCTPRPTNFNGGNGAPVAVTSIEQENARNKVFFEVNVANVGGGTIFDLETMEQCNPYSQQRLTTQHLNKVYLLDARIGSQQLDCTPDRLDGVRLTNGRGSFRCTYNLEYVTARSAYETPLIIELGYGYSTVMQRRTTIKRVI